MQPGVVKNVVDVTGEISTHTLPCRGLAALNRRPASLDACCCTLFLLPSSHIVEDSSDSRGLLKASTLPWLLEKALRALWQPKLQVGPDVYEEDKGEKRADWELAEVVGGQHPRPSVSKRRAVL